MEPTYSTGDHIRFEVAPWPFDSEAGAVYTGSVISSSYDEDDECWKYTVLTDQDKKERVVCDFEVIWLVE